ncbi:hypothetical protein H4Q26_005611 [Puccinia striiformis f. sp. tritici PST-130]|nr:hypothetical protein H4Q26_005611 [Puccinia striiformis f. sp. tritici PST-130]
MSSLNDLSQLAQRYHLKRTRSSSLSGSSSSGSSSSGYGSILSADEEEHPKEDQPDHKPQKNDNRSHSHDKNNSTNSSDHQGAKLGINNKGMQLLLKMGWVEGNGLGVGQKGRKDPIPTPAQTPLLGLGKATQDAYMLSSAISKPKELESIVIARETEEAKVKREEKVKEVQNRVVEREDRLKTFHCQVCDKGYTTITQFEEHERSYAHHHARRALEAKGARKAIGGSAAVEVKLEKERKREAKELERMARAAGMNLDTRPPNSGPPAGSSGMQIDGDKPVNKFKSTGFKVSGFAPISSSATIGFKPISGTGTVNNPNQPSPSSSSATLTRLPPAFVASSSTETSFKSSLNQQPEASTSVDDPSNLNATSTSTPAQPTSKFAQIAARLAARKAAAAAASAGATDPPSGADLAKSNLGQPGSKTHSYVSEVEKMLDL